MSLSFPKPRQDKPRFAKAWTYTARCPKYSMGCRLLMIILRTYCKKGDNQCWPSEDRLAEDFGKCIRHIRRFIKEAIKEGLLSKKPRFPGKRGGTLYTLLDEDEAFRRQLMASPKGNKRTPVSKRYGTPVSIEVDTQEQCRLREDPKIIPIRATR